MDSDYQKFLSLTLKWLGRRPRSKKEVVDYLEKKELSVSLINQIIEYLEKYKLINDAEFAKWLIESRSRSSPRGKRLLVQELKAKGIDISDMEMDINEPNLAFQALNKKHKIWKNFNFRNYKIKASRFLAGKGFSWSAIETAVKKGYNSKDVN